LYKKPVICEKLFITLNRFTTLKKIKTSLLIFWEEVEIAELHVEPEMLALPDHVQLIDSLLACKMSDRLSRIGFASKVTNC
jgi:hypothetical protein